LVLNGTGKFILGYWVPQATKIKEKINRGYGTVPVLGYFSTITGIIISVYWVPQATKIKEEKIN
jgi:hypothetical protein